MTPPRYTSPEHRPLCLDAARHLLAEREARYPGLVEAGKLAATDAAEGLEHARCLVAQWVWITDPASPPLPRFDFTTAGHFGCPERALIAELDRAATIAARRADQAPGDAARRRLADLYAALAWHQRRHPWGVAIVVEVDQCRRATAEFREREAQPKARAA